MRLIGAASIVFVLGLPIAISAFAPETVTKPASGARQVAEHSNRCGQTIGRSDTFSDEQLWTDMLRVREVTVPPGTALAGGYEGNDEPACSLKGVGFETSTVDGPQPSSNSHVGAGPMGQHRMQ